MKRAICQSHRTLEEHYAEAAASDDAITSAIGKMMLDLLPLLDKTLEGLPVWGLTSLYHLMLVSDEKGGSDRLVTITACPNEGYRIVYRLPHDEAPWPDATVSGMAKSKEDASFMVATACNRSGGWKGLRSRPMPPTKDAKPILARVSKLSPQGRLAYLARLAHGITVAARDGYEVQGSGLTDPAKVRKLNELQHQVTGCLADLLATGTSTWTVEALTEMVLDSEDPELSRRLEFFVEVALYHAEKGSA